MSPHCRHDQLSSWSPVADCNADDDSRYVLARSFSLATVFFYPASSLSEGEDVTTHEGAVLETAISIEREEGWERRRVRWDERRARTAASEEAIRILIKN